MPFAKDVHQASTTPTSGQPKRHRGTRVQHPASPPSWEFEAETHLIRLCLDLQLDAMRVALGAAAAQTTSPVDSERPAQPPPWRRWVLEDIETICTLAADVMSSGAALPATLGSDLDRAVPAAAVDNLAARYESMASLLADILPPGDCASSAPYRIHAQEALAHCQERLRQLSSTRLEQTPPRGIPVNQVVEHPPVPGEWLG